MANVSFKIGNKEYVFKPGFFSEFVSIAYPDVAPERTSKNTGTYDFGGDPINIPPPSTTATQDVVAATPTTEATIETPEVVSMFTVDDQQAYQQSVDNLADGGTTPNNFLTNDLSESTEIPPPIDSTNPLATYYTWDQDGNVTGPFTLADYNKRINEGFYGYDPTKQTNPSNPIVTDPITFPGQSGINNETAELFTQDDIKMQLKKQYAWLDPTLTDMFYDEWIKAGRPDDTTDVLNTVRNTNYHKDRFKGFLREDGTQRFESELDYVQQIEQYKIDLAGYGLNPDIFQDDFVDAIINDVSPAKFQQNLDFIYPVLERLAPVVRQNFGQQIGLSQEETDSLDNNVIISALISKNVNDAFLKRELDVAEIRGIGSEFGGIGVEAAGKLAAQGVTGNLATSIGKSVGARFGRLQRLAQRTLGSPNVFGLVDFIEAQVFEGSAGDVLLNKLEAAQRSEFSTADTAARTESGVTGLVEY
tara:strand:+ start:8265 stop:9689 length:1425 start_codon:yes stop_codon:yes gene_type:complete